MFCPQQTTYTEWERIKKLYYGDLVRAAERRVKRERKAIIVRRVSKLETAYRDWIQASITSGAMTASQSPLLPCVSELQKADPFYYLIEAASELPVDFKSSTVDFEAFVTSWTTRKVKDLESMVPVKLRTQNFTLVPIPPKFLVLRQLYIGVRALTVLRLWDTGKF
ncbi:hypothetical protein H0H87_000640 [Tephrocybe sp. NHM501043]|nr:hypothetical protein H0H87_000640 [Tephrocybe sp. NHM501043]